MPRRLQPLTADLFDRLPTVCGGCAFWESRDRAERACGSVCDGDLVREWYSLVSTEWGECGRVATDGDEVLGFVKYAPSRYFPQALTFSSAPTNLDVPLITCIHVSPDARDRGLGKLLLQAVLRDLTLRGERCVETFGTAKPIEREISPMPTVDFLLRQGFTVSRPDPMYPLMRLDMRSLALLTENLESVLESLFAPLRSAQPQRVPTPWIKARS